MAHEPNANDITVGEVLQKFDTEFAAVAHAVQNGEFALWVGSGISRQAPSLGGLIERALEYLRQKSVAAETEVSHLPALERALKLARIDLADVRPLYEKPFDEWPQRSQIVEELWNNYSQLLDIRVQGENSDFMLWDVVDIRQAFADPPPPAATHLCIAILILEGAIRTIASGNWDGFIETAVDRLSNSAGGVLQVVVDPNDMRSVAGKARLLKFHGCILYAAKDPDSFRSYLTGNHTQITEWPDKPKFTAMRAAMVDIATNKKSLVLGLSIQDANLQGIFSAAKQVNPWPWPCTLGAPGHVFCEDEIRNGQRDVLKVVYGDAYNDDIDGIEMATHLRAWGEQVLLALVLKLLSDKLSGLMRLSLESAGNDRSLIQELNTLLNELRDHVAEHAKGDRTAFSTEGIAFWSRLLSIFRTGEMTANPESYEVLSPTNLDNLVGDPNAQATGLGNLAVGLALLQYGRAQALWKVGLPRGIGIDSGALSARATWDGATDRALFFVKSAGEAIKLERNGAYESNSAIVIHADDLWCHMRETGGNARKLRGAPGRTGRTETTHICLAELLGESNEMSELAERFVAAVTI